MPRIEPRITLGNVLIIVQLLAMIWASATAYTSLSNAMTTTVDTVEDHEQRIRALEAQDAALARIEQRIISIEEKLR